MNYTENNNLIAKAMGWKNEIIPEVWTNNAGKYRFLLSYHNNWAELMEVIDWIDDLKINGQHCCFTTQMSHTFRIEYNVGIISVMGHPSFDSERFRMDHETRIQNIYPVVVEFMAWYEKNVK